MLKLLVSPIDQQEAKEAIAGGANIVDVKNPNEGPLGANFPWVIKSIRAITPSNVEVSCTLGDLPNLPGSVALAALGAASLGVNYVKASLYGVRTVKDGVYMMKNVVRAVKEFDPLVKVVAAGFADAKRVYSLNPRLIPKVAFESNCDVAMLDTAVKDGKSLFDNLSSDQLKDFVYQTHMYGLEVALAGSIKKTELKKLNFLGVDIVGVRSAACTNCDRLKGRITKANVEELVETIKNSKLKSNSRI
jgi:uncharacterized protein (UPF0264 family)